MSDYTAGVARGAFIFTVAAFTLTGCRAGDGAHVVVEVRDPGNVALGANTIGIGSAPEALTEERPIEQRFPTTFSVPGAPSEQVQIWVEARDDAEPLARGHVAITFGEAGMTRSATIGLSKVCTASSECDNGRACDGLERCAAGVCTTRSDLDDGAPCENAFGLLGVCTGGECLASCPPADFDDGNSCTFDHCSNGGIVHETLPDETPCALDGSPAFAMGACDTGVCTARAQVRLSWWEAADEIRSFEISGDGRILAVSGLFAESARVALFDLSIPEPGTTLRAEALADDVTLSPDGDVVAYQWQGDIHILRRSTDEAFKNPDLDDAEKPSVSDDGTVVVYTLQARGSPQIVVYRPDTGAWSTLMDSIGRPFLHSRAGSVSGDGSFVAFITANEGLTGAATSQETEAAIVHLPTNEYERVSFAEQGAPAYAENALASADGRFVAYTAWGSMTPADTNGWRDVFRYDRVGGSAEWLTAGLGEPGRLEDLSADGTVALVRSRTGIYVHDDGQLRALDVGSDRIARARMSGDGSRVVVEVADEFGFEDLVMFDLEALP